MLNVITVRYGALKKMVREGSNMGHLSKYLNEETESNADNQRGFQGFPGGSVVKNSPASAGNAKNAGLIPELGKSPGGGNSNPLQYSCLENPMDRGVWWATVQGVTKSQTQLSTLHQAGGSSGEKSEHVWHSRQEFIPANLCLWVSMFPAFSHPRSVGHRTSHSVLPLLTSCSSFLLFSLPSFPPSVLSSFFHQMLTESLLYTILYSWYLGSSSKENRHGPNLLEIYRLANQGHL